MSICSPPPSSIAIPCTRSTCSDPVQLVRVTTVPSLRHRPTFSSRIYSSKPSSGADGSDPRINGFRSKSLHGPQPHSSHKSVPVFVTLPPDIFSKSWLVAQREMILLWLRSLALCGVEGVVVEVWWGIVESNVPGDYDWKEYLEVFELADRFGLKVIAIMAFHQCGAWDGDHCWIPLPNWVRKEMHKEPDLAHSNRFGMRNQEYISLGCDEVPRILGGRTPIQVYSDFMKNFRDSFSDYLGVVITGIQVGMGPAGELRYPSCPSEKLSWAWRHLRKVGEFQCYDKYMTASLKSYAQNVGMPEWGNTDLLVADSQINEPENTSFFRSDNGIWNTPYGRFFLEWYSGMLLQHGERLSMAAGAIFSGTGVKISAKVPAIHWHYTTSSHPSELTAGYYSALISNVYLPIARMLGKYNMTLCCACFDLRDKDEMKIDRSSRPEVFVRRVMSAARNSKILLMGENSRKRYDYVSLEQIMKNSKRYMDRMPNKSLSFNFVRMDEYMFDRDNWGRFAWFVDRMSDMNTFQAKLGFGGRESRQSSDTALRAEAVGIDDVVIDFAYY